MTAPLLLNALQIAWVCLLRSNAITDNNIQTAPLRVLASVLQAAAEGEKDATMLAAAAISEWDADGAPSGMTIN